jgi:hypothetical protein
MPKTSAKELEARKERARLQDEHRQQVEAQIAELEKQGLSAEQIRDAFGLWFPEYPPAMQLLFDRLKDVEDAKVYDAVHRAVVDLLRSDMPLDRQSRQWIADLFFRLTFPNQKDDARRQREQKAAVADALKRFYQDRGMTALEAEEQVVEDLSLKSVDALRKKKQRAK